MLRIGSRGSALALWQANHVKSLLEANGVPCGVIVIKTTGDQVQNVPVSELGTKGVFTKEIEDALLKDEIDLAVHSLKDMLTVLPEGLCLAAAPERQDARDVIAGKKFEDLPAGASVGTSSVRRAAQLRELRPDLEIREIRGNVDTRLRKLDEGQYDAILLAAAGLHRLGLQKRIAQEFSFEKMTPAPGQGALGIETRLAGAGREAARLLNCEEVWTAVTAERAVLEALGGGCQTPLGAYAEVFGSSMRLWAAVFRDGAMRRLTVDGHVARAREFGLETGERLK